MSRPVYPGPYTVAPGLNLETHGKSPASITDLGDIAVASVRWEQERDRGLKHWLRTAEKSRKAGDAYASAFDYEKAFIEYARAATIVLEKLPTHKDYRVMLSSEQRNNLGMNGQDILDSLSRIKPILLERHDRWVAENRNIASGSRPSSLDGHRSDGSRSDDSVRRRHLESQAQEERARQALEAARREEDWREEEIARRKAEDHARQVREEAGWMRQMAQEKRREAAEAAAQQREAEALAAAERERAAQLQRREEEARRRAMEERGRQEQEALRRQQVSEDAALAAQLEAGARISPVPPSSASSQQSLAVAGSPPGRPAHPARPSYSDIYGSNVIAPAPMPLESPTRYDDDSSTDVENADRQPRYGRSRPAEKTPSKARAYTPATDYPPPITTTSPPPPELGIIRYPTLMSQHQLTQGYVPSLQSMFAKSSGAPARATDSSLLFDHNTPSSLFPNEHPGLPAPVIPPYPSGMPMPQPGRHPAVSYPQHLLQQIERPSSSASGSRSYSSSRQSLEAPRIVQSNSTESSVRDLKTIKVPRECLGRFLSIARVNTLQNKETCGLLLGKDKGNKFVITTLLVPRQRATSDTCTMDEEELVLAFTEERQLITLGWIHTHPTQSCFMSSVDLHTHSGFQRMLPESFAIVCAPASTPTFGIFRLTDPGGLQTILDCTAKEAFHPHPPELPIYTDCDKSHVQMKDMPLEIVDLRP